MAARAVQPGDRLAFERALWDRQVRRVAGVDEAGRGPLAGPVVAAAVVLPHSLHETGVPSEWRRLNDSKQLTPRQREAYFTLLLACNQVLSGIARVEAAQIDRLNILRATHLAMSLALDQLRPGPQHALVDGRPVPGLRCPHTAIVKGDARSYSIAAASVLAKVTRDRIMLEYDRQYPEYGFAEHKGYPTSAHLAALERHGPCPIHRRSFAPVQPRQIELF